MEIINVIAATLDGYIAAHQTESDEDRVRYRLTSAEDHAFVARWLSEADAVITGANSLRASRGVWDLKNSKGIYPHWYILCRRRLPSKLSFFKQTMIPRVIVMPDPLKNDFVYSENLSYLYYRHEDPAQFLVEHCRKQECKKVVLFGGGEINALFYNNRLVDRLVLTVSPVILARPTGVSLVSTALGRNVELERVASHAGQNHVFLEYKVLK